MVSDKLIEKLMAGVERYKAERAAREQKEQEEKEASERKAKEERQQKIADFEKEQARKFNYRPLSDLKKIDAEEFTRLLVSTKKPPSEANKIDFFDLARCYLHGIHVKKTELNPEQQAKNKRKAFEWFNKANSIGYGFPPAEHNLAILLIEGIGVDPHPDNHRRAVELLMTAAASFPCYISAHARVGFCYLKNIGVEPSFDNIMSAYLWYKGGVDLGDLKAEDGVKKCSDYLDLFWISLPKDDPEENNKDDVVMEDAERPEDAELKNDADMSKRFPHFEFVHKPHRTRSKLNAIYDEAHQKPTTPEAQYYYAYCLKVGNFIMKDPKKDAAKEAFQNFRQAAEAGFPPAQYQLCLCYKEKYGIPEDDKKNNLEQALVWCRKAANAGYAKAACELGVALEGSAEKQKELGDREGYLKDMQEAFVWLMRASIKNIPFAQERVADYIRQRKGLPKDFINPYLDSITLSAEAKAANERAAVPKKTRSNPAITLQFKAAAPQASRKRPNESTDKNDVESDKMTDVVDDTNAEDKRKTKRQKT